MIYVEAGEPVIAQSRPAVQIDCGDDAHVALTPLAWTVRHLPLEQLEALQAQLGRRDSKRLFEHDGELVLHHEQLTVRLMLDKLLQDTQVVQRTE